MNELLEESIQRLSERIAGKPVDRDDLMAYALILARTQHFPSRASQSDTELLNKNSDIFEVEPDRCIKQRRIYLNLLAEYYSNL